MRDKMRVPSRWLLETSNRMERDGGRITLNKKKKTRRASEMAIINVSSQRGNTTCSFEFVRIWQFKCTPHHSIIFCTPHKESLGAISACCICSRHWHIVWVSRFKKKFKKKKIHFSTLPFLSFFCPPQINPPHNQLFFNDYVRQPRSVQEGLG